MAAMLASFALLTSLIPLAVAAPSAYVYRTKEEIPPPHGWIKHGRPSGNQTITLRVGLPQHNFHILEDNLYQVSDPDHVRYGQHLSKGEVEALVAPHPESLDAVNKWLSSFGFEGDHLVRSPANDWVTITLSLEKAEEMLDTTYYLWTHIDSGDSLVRTTSYSLPADLHDHVDVIQPTTMFGRLKRQASMIYPNNGRLAPAPVPVVKTAPVLLDNGQGTAIDPSCNDVITISCLQQLYNFVGYLPANNPNNSIGITGYLDEYANFEDLQLFYGQQRPDALNSSFNVISLNGGLNSQDPDDAGIEANLDVQFAFGVAYPINGTFYTTAGSPPFIPDIHTPRNTNEPYQEWLDFILNQTNPPLSISTSYADDEQTVPESYARRVCAGFAQLGARGVSLLFASGDYGVGDGSPDPEYNRCITNDGRNTTRFMPSFPASCPYVTSVGATEHMLPEVATSEYFSGGGFSNYFTRPPYQDGIVDEYVSKLPNGTYEGLYNPGGRGIPDVAARGDYYQVWWRGDVGLVGGTSASSPAFAGIVALLNDARLAKQQSPLGFLNPILYKKGISGFNDILLGYNAGCGTTGFNVSEGWDPVTGLGTPDFGKLKDLLT